MSMSVIERQCESLAVAGLVPADRLAEVKDALGEAWRATVGFALSAENVTDVWPEVTEEQACRVLELITGWDMAGLSSDLIAGAIDELFPDRNSAGRPAEGSEGYAGAFLLSDLTDGVSSLTEVASRLQHTAGRIRAMARAGVRLAGEQADPHAVVVVADDEATAKAFGLERSGEGGMLVVT